MVEINNQRKAFDMLAWSEGTDNGTSENQKSWLWRHCRRRAIYWLPDHPRKLVTLNPKLKSTGAGRYQLLSRWWDAYRKQLGRWKTFQQSDAALQQIMSKGALHLWLIVVISVGNRPLVKISASRCRGAGYGQFEHKADSLIAKFKEAGGTVREIDVWAESPRLSPLWLSASSSACHGLLIITVITPLPTKPSATKMPENWSWWTRQLLTCRCVSVMLPRSMQNTKELADAKAEKWCSAWWCCRWSSSVAHQSSLSVSVKPPSPPAWIMQPPPTGRHRWTGLFHPQREADHYAKTTGRNPEAY